MERYVHSKKDIGNMLRITKHGFGMFIATLRAWLNMYVFILFLNFFPQIQNLNLEVSAVW
jgi:hypothetical protein